MDKKDILELLDDSFTVYNVAEDAIDTNNGLLNKQYLETRKEKLLTEAITYLTSELVTVKQEYPENNISDVTLTTDFVVIKREDFDAIKQYIEENE